MKKIAHLNKDQICGCICTTWCHHWVEVISTLLHDTLVLLHHEKRNLCSRTAPKSQHAPWCGPDWKVIIKTGIATDWVVWECECEWVSFANLAQITKNLKRAVLGSCCTVPSAHLPTEKGVTTKRYDERATYSYADQSSRTYCHSWFVAENPEVKIQKICCCHKNFLPFPLFWAHRLGKIS